MINTLTKQLFEQNTRQTCNNMTLETTRDHSCLMCNPRGDCKGEKKLKTIKKWYKPVPELQHKETPRGDATWSYPYFWAPPRCSKNRLTMREIMNTRYDIILYFFCLKTKNGFCFHFSIAWADSPSYIRTRNCPRERTIVVLFNETSTRCSLGSRLHEHKALPLRSCQATAVATKRCLSVRLGAPHAARRIGWWNHRSYHGFGR